MRRRLVFVDHFAEPQRSRQPQRAPLIKPPDLHFLARKVVVHQIDLQRRIRSIARIRIPPLHLTQRRQRLLRNLLVAGHIADLLVIGKRDQVIGVRRILVTRMDRQEPPRSRHRFVVLLRHVVRKRAHQLRPPRPRRIRMLALDLVEQRGCHLILLAVELVFRCVIERIYIARDITGVAARLRIAAAEPQGCTSGKQRYRHAKRNAIKDFFVHGMSLRYSCPRRQEF